AVRAKVSGYITQVLVDEGQAVKKGQTLFRIETEALSQDAGAAQANINAAQIEVDRLRPLVEKNIISPVQLTTAEARLAQAKATYKSILANIDYATIKSPVVTSASSAVTTISVTDDVYATFTKNERDYLHFIQPVEGESLVDKIKNLPPVELELVNGEAYKHKGKIETVTRQVNTSTGATSFRATFPNPNRLLANGNSGRIRIPRTYENVPVVPASATFEQQGRVYVFKVQGDTLAVSSSISVKDRVDNIV